MRYRSISIMTALFWLAGCHAGGAEYHRPACAWANQNHGLAQFESCDANRTVDMIRGNRAGNQGRGGGP